MSSVQGRVISSDARHSIQRRLRLVDIDASLFASRAKNNTSAVAQIETDLHISSEVEFEARLGRCSLTALTKSIQSGPRAQPRIIDPPNRSQSIGEHYAYDLFTSDVSSAFFIATFAALNGGTTLASAGTLLTEQSPIIAISGWHRKEEVTVYDESELALDGQATTTNRQRRRFRVLLDSSRASYCINAHTFDKDNRSKSLANLLSYLECEEAHRLVSSDDGSVWGAKEERILPDPIWWLPEDMPSGAMSSANKTPHKLCVEKDQSSQCVLGATDSSLCDVRFSLCHERSRTGMLPDDYLQACDAPQRVQALIQSGFPLHLGASGGRTSFTLNGEDSSNSHSQMTGDYDALTSDMVGLSLSADDPDMLAIIHALRGSLLEVSSPGSETSVTSNYAATSSTTSSTKTASLPTTKRGRPPKTSKTPVTDATQYQATESALLNTASPSIDAAVSIAPRVRFGIPPIYRIKLRQSVLLGLNVEIDEEICNLVFPHLAIQLGDNDAAITAVIGALRRRPLWRVDFTKVWQSDSLSRARTAYRQYAKTANNASIATSSSSSAVVDEDVSPSSYEIEIECVDVVYWCTLICHCDSSKTPDDALALIASAMLTLTSSGVLSTVLPSVRSHLTSDLGSLLPPLWVIRPKVASF